MERGARRRYGAVDQRLIAIECARAECPLSFPLGVKRGNLSRSLPPSGEQDSSIQCMGGRKTHDDDEGVAAELSHSAAAACWIGMRAFQFSDWIDG